MSSRRQPSPARTWSLAAGCTAFLVTGVGPFTVGALTVGLDRRTAQIALAPALSAPITQVSALFGDLGNAESGEVTPEFWVVGSHGVTPRAVSADGHFIAFTSNASNLVADDSNGNRDVFVKDLLVGTIERASIAVAGGSGSGGGRGSLSADGRFVAFESYDDLAPGAYSVAGLNVFVRDCELDTMDAANVGLNDTIVGSYSVAQPKISADGRYVVFQSDATSLVAGDTNNKTDVFLRDRANSTTTRISLSSAGEQLAVASNAADLSADGHYALFLRPTAGWSLAHRYDITTGADEIATPGLSQAIPSVNVSAAQLSDDGRYVGFIAAGFGQLTELPVTPVAQVYRHDMETDETIGVSLDGEGDWATAPVERFAMSGDGRFVTFTSKSVNLAPNGPGAGNGMARLFRRDLVTGVTELISPAPDIAFDNEIDPSLAISSNGTSLAFVTAASNVVGADPLGFHDIFVRTSEAPLEGDLNGDGIVGPADLGLLLGAWGASQYDLDGDGVVGASDLAILLGAWTA